MLVGVDAQLMSRVRLTADGWAGCCSMPKWVRRAHSGGSKQHRSPPPAGCGALPGDPRPRSMPQLSSCSSSIKPTARVSESLPTLGRFSMQSSPFGFLSESKVGRLAASFCWGDSEMRIWPKYSTAYQLLCTSLVWSSLIFDSIPVDRAQEPGSGRQYTSSLAGFTRPSELASISSTSIPHPF
jgi:hypothetical protein